jgi:hypothetical protein
MFKIIDSYPNQHEIPITDEGELRDTLLGFLRYGPRVILLKSPESGSLTIGIGSPYGFVKFMNENGALPYLIAIENKNSELENSFIEFDAGGIPTPIPIGKCILLDRVIEISIYFFKNNRLPNFIAWEVE